jgi:hypothetical protein
MPEDKYDYKPREREMSFKEQLLHIQDNMKLEDLFLKINNMRKRSQRTLKSTNNPRHRDIF